MICSTCHAERRVMLTHSLKIGRRVVEYSICASCELAEEAREA